MKHNLRFPVIVLLICLIPASLYATDSISTDWFYSSLDRAGRQLYDAIEDAVYCNQEKVYTELSSSDAYWIMNGFLDDNPGVFWVDRMNATYGTEVIDGRFVHYLKLALTHQDTLEKDQHEFISVVSLFSKYQADAPNDWIKLYQIYDYLGSTIEYSMDYPDQTMWSVFFRGVGVCAGFARSFQYLALMEGIPSVVVHGWSKDENGNKGDAHLWAMAQINGKWYHFDPTWGLLDHFGEVDFNYFCRSEESISRTHIINSRYPIPKSTDDSLSYVSMRNRFMHKFSLYDFIIILKDALDHDELSFTVEFGSLSELDKAVSTLINDKVIWEMLTDLNATGIKSYRYNTDKNNYSLKFVFYT